MSESQNVINAERPYWAAGLNEVEFELAQRGLFGVEAAAAYLGTSPGYVRKLISQGKLTARKIGKRLRVQKAQLDAILGAA